jgi:hypothetical protein
LLNLLSTDGGDTAAWFMKEISRSNRIKNVVSLQVAREHARQPRGASNRHVSKRSNQRLLERLEAENAQLRGSVVDLMLQLQAAMNPPRRHLAAGAAAPPAASRIAGAQTYPTNYIMLVVAVKAAWPRPEKIPPPRGWFLPCHFSTQIVRRDSLFVVGIRAIDAVRRQDGAAPC